MVTNPDNKELMQTAEDLSDASLGIDLSCIRDSVLIKDTEGRTPMVPIYSTTIGMMVNESIFEKEKIFRGATSGEFLDKLLADAALNKKNSQTMEDTYKALQLTIENQRQGIMGVDSDEEASALVQYQNMYTLSSKMIQTLTEVYDQLILNTGV